VANTLKPDSLESGFFLRYLLGGIAQQSRFDSGAMSMRGLTTRSAAPII
jgi:hypothetical protein